MLKNPTLALTRLQCRPMDTPAARPYTYEVHEHDTITATGQLLLDKPPEPGDLVQLNN